MALSRFSLALSLLLLSLLAIASAIDYSEAIDGIPANSPQAKPEGEVKPSYGTKQDTYKPKPEKQEKPDYSKKPYVVRPKPEAKPQDTYKPKQEEKETPDYNKRPYDVKPKPEGQVKPQGTYKPKQEEKEKPDYSKRPHDVKPKPEGQVKPQGTYKPKQEEKEKPDYSKRPYDVKPKSEGQVKPQGTYKPKQEEKEQPDYSKKPYDVKPKQDTYKPKPEEKEKSGYNGNSYVVKPELKGDEKPSYGTKLEEMKNRLSIAVQGVVLCKTSSEYYPIQGAFATIKCKGVDEAGVEKTISVCSKATDAKGYFFATLSNSSYDKLKLKECRAYLKSSPLEKCNVPTNVNKAIEGALLSSFRVLKDNKDKLYSVGPFFYTSQANKPTPKYGY